MDALPPRVPTRCSPSGTRANSMCCCCTAQRSVSASASVMQMLSGEEPSRPRVRTIEARLSFRRPPDLQLFGSQCLASVEQVQDYTCSMEHSHIASPGEVFSD
jgi:hypothetical protein